MRQRLRTEEIRMRRTRVAVAALGVAALLAGGTARAVDEADELMPAKIGLVKPAKLAKFVAKPVSPALFALPDASNAPTAEGGSVSFFDTIFLGAGANTYALPAAGWSGLGNPAGSKGYKYKGVGSPTDPCKVVLIKEKVVKAVCKGPGVSVTPPLSGQLGIVLTAGAATKRYCATLGGTEVKNEAGNFKRKDAPPPGACPAIPVPVCGNGALEGSEVCDDGNLFNGDGCRDNCTPEICGDGIKDPQEQCDDGNNTPGDGCDAICNNELGTCSPVTGTRSVTVSISTPSPLAGIELDLDYPQLEISIPGSGGSPVVLSRVTIFPSVGLKAVNDLDTDLKVVLADSSEVINSGDVFNVQFDQCVDQDQNICNRNQNVIGCCPDNSPSCLFNPPVCPTGNFPTSSVGPCTSPAGACPSDNVCVSQNDSTACQVISPVDSDGQPVAGVTCSVSISSPSGAFLDGEDL